MDTRHTESVFLGRVHFKITMASSIKLLLSDYPKHNICSVIIIILDILYFYDYDEVFF